MKNLFIFIEGAIVAGVCICLSLIPIEFGPFNAFNLSLGMIPLSVYAVRRGLFPALCTGLVWGLLHFVIGKVYFLTMPQFFLDYILAFTFAGLFGAYSKVIKSKLSNRKGFALYIVLASVTSCFARSFFAFLSGGIFFAEYAPPWLDGWTYSLIFNGLNAIANTVMVSVVLIILSKTVAQLFTLKTNN